MRYYENVEFPKNKLDLKKFGYKAKIGFSFFGHKVHIVIYVPFFPKCYIHMQHGYNVTLVCNKTTLQEDFKMLQYYVTFEMS